jgi:hypothetical protein
MRVFFLITFLIASTSAFAPLANASRSKSVLAQKAAKASPVKAAVKAVPLSKKQPTKASLPMKGVPLKVKGVKAVAKASPVKAAAKAVPLGKKQLTKASKIFFPMKGTPLGKTSPAKGGYPKASLLTVARVNKKVADVKKIQPAAKKLKKGVDVKKIQPAAKKLFGIF